MDADDWVVADSEGEEDISADSLLLDSANFADPRRITQREGIEQTTPNMTVSAISSFSSKRVPPSADSSTISHFESMRSPYDTSHITTPSTSGKPSTSSSSRPKPRPAFKGKQAASAGPDVATTAQTAEVNTPSKHSTLVTSDPGIRSTVIHPPATSFSDTASIGPDLAERVKMRSRRKPIEPTVAQPPTTLSRAISQAKKRISARDDVIELASDSEDELTLRPVPCAASTLSRRTLTSPEVIELHQSQNSVPVLTTSPSVPTSTLPPSDFPSTIPTELVSSPGLNLTGQRRRRRVPPKNNLIWDHGDSEMDHAIQNPVANTGIEGPLFFAPTSSPFSDAPDPSAADDIVLEEPTPPPARAKPAAKRKRKDNETGEGDDRNVKPKKRSRKDKSEGSKSKGKKKAKTHEEDEAVFQGTEMNTTSVSLPECAENALPVPSLAELLADDSRHNATPQTNDQDVLVSPPERKTKERKSGSNKKSKNVIVDSDEGESAEEAPAGSSHTSKHTSEDNLEQMEPEKAADVANDKQLIPEPEKSIESVKENVPPASSENNPATPVQPHIPKIPRRSFTLKSKSTPMSELIRRVNSQPGSPFAPSRSSPHPLLKSSKSALSRIAPLHPNRRTPPPPPPRPPKPKERKTKKQLEMEEQWEMELEEEVDGWLCLTDVERDALRKAKRDRMMGYGECED